MGEPIRIAMVGGGAMGGALIDGFRGQLIDDRRVQVRVVEADQQRAETWQGQEGVEVTSLSIAVADADVVVLAVKPHQILEVLQEVAPVLPESTTVVSIAAGIPLSAMHGRLGDRRAVIRTMPNTPTRIGRGVIGLAAGPGCAPEQVSLVKRLLEKVAVVFELPEEQLDALTATSGSGPAYVFYLAEAMRRGAEELGLPTQMAGELVAETLAGAAELLRREPMDAQTLRESVTSKGGTTAAALAVFDAADMRHTIAQAMRANSDRAREMADEFR